MKVGRLLLVFLVGGTVIAMVAVVGLRSRGSERRATALIAEPTAIVARAGAPAVGAHSIAETPEQRERTLQARRLLTAALIMGAASSQGVPPAQVVAPDSEAAEKPVEDAHDNRRRIVDAFIASGNATGNWTQAAPDVFSGIRKSVPADLARHVNVRHVECYEKGCLADVTYSDMAAFEKAAPLFIQDDAFERWPGPRGRTAPETMASGRVEVTWMLMNPSASVDEKEGQL